MLTRTRITSMLLTLLFVASLIFAVSSLVTEPDKAGYSAVTVGVFGGLLLLHLRKWRWTPEALVACMTLLVVANSDVNFMRSNVSLTVLLPAVLAAVLLSPRWTIGVFIATMLGLALFIAVAIGEGTTIAFGPNFSVINLLTLTIITAGIATSSAVARAGQRAAEEQAHQAQTTARRADETLALLDTVVQSAPIGFAFFDTALRYQLITPRFAAVNRLPTEEHLGHTAHEVSPEFATTVEPFLRRVLDTGAPISRCRNV